MCTCTAWQRFWGCTNSNLCSCNHTQQRRKWSDDVACGLQPHHPTLRNQLLAVRWGARSPAMAVESIPRPRWRVDHHPYNNLLLAVPAPAHQLLHLYPDFPSCISTLPAGVWIIIELAVQFGHYGHACYGGEGELAGR